MSKSLIWCLGPTLRYRWPSLSESAAASWLHPSAALWLLGGRQVEQQPNLGSLLCSCSPASDCTTSLPKTNRTQMPVRTPSRCPSLSLPEKKSKRTKACARLNGCRYMPQGPEDFLKLIIWNTNLIWFLQLSVMHCEVLCHLHVDTLTYRKALSIFTVCTYWLILMILFIKHTITWNTDHSLKN